jgi:hypothetical protein
LKKVLKIIIFFGRIIACHIILLWGACDEIYVAKSREFTEDPSAFIKNTELKRNKELREKISYMTDPALIMKEMMKYSIKRKYSWTFFQSSWSAEWFLIKKWFNKIKKEINNLNIEIMNHFNKVLPPKKRLALLKSKNFGIYYWSRVYNSISRKNSSRIQSISRAFLFFQKENNLSRLDILNLILSFIQSIPYQIPNKEPFQLLAPPDVIKRGHGDCDSKSLLMIIILKQLGYNAVMLHSFNYLHAMVGVHTKATGFYKKYYYKKYYFCEVTNSGWRIGSLDPKMNNVKKWNVIPIR